MLNLTPYVIRQKTGFINSLHSDDATKYQADGTPLVIAVGAENARKLILPHILSRGYVPGGDAWFVA